MSNSWEWFNGSDNTFFRLEMGYGVLTLEYGDSFGMPTGWWLRSDSGLVQLFLGEQDEFDDGIPPLQIADNVMWALNCRPDVEDYGDF